MGKAATAVLAINPIIQYSITPIRNWWGREDLHLQGSQILDLWGLLFPLNHSAENGAPGRNLTGNHSLRRAGL